MDPITLNLRVGRTPAASLPSGGELSAEEIDANFTNLKAAAEQLDTEKVATADLVAVDNQRPPREYLSRLYFDCCVHDDRALQYLLDTVGSEQVMLGTDYPFPLGEQEPGSGIERVVSDAAAQKQLFSQTALNWLGSRAQAQLGF